MTSSNLVQKIYALFTARGMSQAELARRIGMQPSHLNRFLKGHGDMGSARLVSLLSELGVDLERVVDEALRQQKTADGREASAALTSLESQALTNWIKRLREESQRERVNLTEEHLWM